MNILSFLLKSKVIRGISVDVKLTPHPMKRWSLGKGGIRYASYLLYLLMLHISEVPFPLQDHYIFPFVSGYFLFISTGGPFVSPFITWVNFEGSPKPSFVVGFLDNKNLRVFVEGYLLTYRMVPSYVRRTSSFLPLIRRFASPPRWSGPSSLLKVNPLGG